jgi:hypothetical protein
MQRRRTQPDIDLTVSDTLLSFERVPGAFTSAR